MANDFKITAVFFAMRNFIPFFKGSSLSAGCQGLLLRSNTACINLSCSYKNEDEKWLSKNPKSFTP
jgi:hypothetical protein